MKFIALAAAAAALLMPGAAAAQVTTINFESESTGAKANGYTVSGVSFYDTLGADLAVGNYGSQGNGLTLGVFNDDTSGLRMVFSALSTDLSLSFGNDGHLSNANRTFLELFLGGVSVGSTFVAHNGNDIMDQQIGISGVNFDEARVTYYLNGSPGNLIELVDNISFSAAVPSAVPEPSTWAMMLIGFGAVGFSMRRRRAPLVIAQAA